jgi:hypothetical protein
LNILRHAIKSIDDYLSDKTWIIKI